MSLITKKFEFEAAHKLPNHSGKCKSLHGHSYQSEITLKGEINKKTGMVMDFGDIKKIVKKNVIKLLDHMYLNEILNFVPTAENLAKFIFEMLDPYFDNKLYSVVVWETHSSKAEYRKGE